MYENCLVCLAYKTTTDLMKEYTSSTHIVSPTTVTYTANHSSFITPLKYQICAVQFF